MAGWLNVGTTGTASPRKDGKFKGRIAPAQLLKLNELA